MRLPPKSGLGFGKPDFPYGLLMTTATETSAPALADLARQARRWSALRMVCEALRKGKPACVDGVWGSSGALIVAALCHEADGPMVVVLPSEKELDAFAADAAGFGVGTQVIFPAWDRLPEEVRSADPVWGSRLRVVSAMEAAHVPKLIVTTLPALLQPVPSRESRSAASKSLSVGQTLNVDEFLRWLIDQGFERVSTINSPGEVSLHGGILDVFSPDAADPVRIELFGEEIDSLRTFDADTQRKIRDLNQVTLTIVSPTTTLVPSPLASVPPVPSPLGERARERGPLATDRPLSLTLSPEAGARGHDAATDAPPLSNPLPRSGGEGTGNKAPREAQAATAENAHFLDAIPTNSWIALFEPDELRQAGQQYLDRLDDLRGLFGVAETFAKAGRFPMVSLARLLSGSLGETAHLHVTSIERFTGTKGEALRELADVVQHEEQVLIACHNEAAQERLAELLQETDAELAQRVNLCLGSVSRGFRLVAEKTVVLSDNELFGRVQIRRVPRKRRHESRAIDSFLELDEGDLVVHLAHGIARYRGMELLDKDGQQEEHLHARIPRRRQAVRAGVADPPRAEVRRRRQGGAGTVEDRRQRPGRSKKKQVAEAVVDLAADMIRLQAERETQAGHRLSRPTATGSRSSRRRSPTRKPPTSCERSPISRTTCSGRGRWTG